MSTPPPTSTEVKTDSAVELPPPAATSTNTTVSLPTPETTDTTEMGAEVTLGTVQDGDTISVSYRGADESVRLIGFDAPEVGEPFSAKATAALEGLVSGETLRLEFDVEERDQYGRLLAYVWMGTKMVNVEILRQGVATVYTVPPNVKYVDVLIAAQNEAQAAGLGIWGGPSDSPVKISKLHPNAEGDDNFNLNDEWVEFRVLVAGTLRGYSVEDDSGHQYKFPDRIFEGDQLLKLHTGSGSDTQTDLYWGMTASAVWNNAGDAVKVLDAQGHVVSSKGY